MTEATRAYIYRILLAVSALATGYGLVTGEKAALWLAVASAIIGNGQATAFTSTDRG